jgi:AcrR family transcriptional regulator
MKADGALSAEAIVDAASRICESEGYEAISMRRVADEFGVTAMALYGYVSTKQALLELVADRYMAELDLAENAADWEDRLARVFRSFYELLVTRPVLAHVLTHQTVDAPSAFRMAEVVMSILREHGFDDAEAVELTKVLAGYSIGMALSRAPRGGSSAEQRGRVNAIRNAAGEYPNLSVAAELYVGWTDEVFDRGLDQLLLTLRHPEREDAVR